MPLRRALTEQPAFDDFCKGAYAGAQVRTLLKTAPLRGGLSASSGLGGGLPKPHTTTPPPTLPPC